MRSGYHDNRLLLKQYSLFFRENMRHYRFYTLWLHHPEPLLSHRRPFLPWHLRRLHSRPDVHLLLLIRTLRYLHQEVKLKLTYLESIATNMVSFLLSLHRLLTFKEYCHEERPHLPEFLLLRDTLYLMQGISGKHVSFAPSQDVDLGGQLAFREDTVRFIISRSFLG